VDLHLSVTGILKVSPANQQLFKDNQVMEDEKALQDYGLTSNSAKAQCPGSVGLALR
jgi:transcription elongation factor B subunit 2